MKTISSLFVSLLLAPLCMNGQATVTPAATSESPQSPTQEKNIQAYILLLRSDVRKQKAQVMGTVMDLDAGDSAKFWPIYKDFEAELTQFYDSVGVLVKNYSDNFGNVNDALADQLATKLLDLEQQRNDMKRRYYERFKTALDPVVAIKFLQVENQIERIVDLQIASQLPVVERGQQ